MKIQNNKKGKIVTIPFKELVAKSFFAMIICLIIGFLLCWILFVK